MSFKSIEAIQQKLVLTIGLNSKSIYFSGFNIQGCKRAKRSSRCAFVQPLYPAHIVVMLFKPFEIAFAHPLLSSSMRTLTIGILLTCCAGETAV